MSRQRMRLELSGLSLSPSQVFGAVRIVPLCRARVRDDLRLGKLSQHDWDLGRTAHALGTRATTLIVGLKNAGLAYLLKDHVLRAAEQRVTRR